MGGSVLVGVLECRGSSRRAPRGCSALSATFPCVTSSGAQAGAMPTSGELVEAATNGALEEVQTLIENRANIDEKNEVQTLIERCKGYFNVVYCSEYGSGVL